MISHFNLDHSNQYILDGDFNSLSHKSLIQTGLQSIYYGPTHRGNNLDRLYGINIDAKLFNSATYVSHIKTQVPPANANFNIDADTFNSYFASISSSSNYIEPTHKLSEPHNINYITSSTVYYTLNKSFSGGTGSDGLPGWFFKLIFFAICEPLSTIYNNIKQSFFSCSVD